MFIELFSIALLAIIGYFWVKNPFNYWKNKGIEQESLRLVLYDITTMLLKRKPFVELIKEMYDRSPNKRYVAGFNFLIPKLTIHDPELIKELTVKNFDHFLDRNNMLASESGPMNNNLLVLEGERWKRMRSIVSPVFTSSKMRNLFVLIEKNAQQLVQHFLDKNETTITIEAKDTVTRFTNDVIANAVFGIDCDSLKDPENEFYLTGKELTDFSSFKKTLTFVILLTMPQFFVKLFRIRMFPEKINNFFVNIVKENIASREKHGIVRPDLINLLLEARKNGPKVQEDLTDQKIPDTGFATAQETDLGKTATTNSTISDMDITAQAMIFFFAGFETAAVLMSFIFYELAVNRDIQKRLQEEVDAVADSSQDKKLTYEKLNGMKYLDMVVCETLRKWPGAIAIDRVCTKNYTIEPKCPGEVPVEIEKGSIIWVPIFGIHRDPQIYPDPEKFDPERFSDENKGRIHGGIYLPFGSGPRNCIGSRFALLETKALVYHLLLNFNIVQVEKTQVPLKLSKRSFSFAAEKGFWVGLERRK